MTDVDAVVIGSGAGGLAAALALAQAGKRVVVFADLGTPLTNVHFVASTRGNLYGTEKSRWQVGPWAFPLRTPIRGLTLCGASTISHGVMGATLSGLLAARRILGGTIHELLRAKGPAVTLLPVEGNVVRPRHASSA